MSSEMSGLDVEVGNVQTNERFHVVTEYIGSSTITALLSKRRARPQIPRILSRTSSPAANHARAYILSSFQVDLPRPTKIILQKCSSCR